jgi:ABC-type sugar transport system ATPase subunit
VRLAGTVIPLSAAVRTAAARDRLTELVVGIRPEHLHLVAVAAPTASGVSGVSAASAASADGAAGRPSAPGSAANHRELTGEILLVEELGADALMHVRLTGEGGSDDGTVVARTEGRKSPAPGQQVLFGVQPDDVFAFNPETGARLLETRLMEVTCGPSCSTSPAASGWQRCLIPRPGQGR